MGKAISSMQRFVAPARAVTSHSVHELSHATRRANLSGQVHLLVGALGPVHVGLVTRMLDADSIVVAPSGKLEGLEMLQETLGYPAGLVTMHQSVSSSEGAMEVVSMIKQELGRLDGVVAHGGLVHARGDHPWEDVNRASSHLSQGSILDSSPEVVMAHIQELLVTHVSTARAMMPLLESQDSALSPSYTFVTGGLQDGRKDWMQFGAEGPALTAMYGFGLALRGATTDSRVRVNEVRIGMELNRSDDERMSDPRSRPLSLDLGALATYVAESKMKGQRLRASDNVELDGLLHRFGAFQVQR